MKLVVRAVLVGLLFGLTAITVVGGRAGAASDLTLVTGPMATGVRAGTPQTLNQFVHSGGPTGDLVPNQAVDVEVIAGPNLGVSSTVYSDANGLAQWRYPTKDLFPNGGTDTVKAWIDEDGNGKADAGEPSTTNDLVTLPYNNQAPLAGDIETSIAGNAPADIQLSGSDPDGSPVGFAIDTKPQHGSVPSFLTGPFLTYTPDDGFIGTDTFTYTVTDSDGAAALGTVTIDVRSPDQPPVEGSDLKADFATTAAPEGNALAVSVASTATVNNATIKSTTWDFGDGSKPIDGVAGTHVYAKAGTFNVTMTVTDSTGSKQSVTKPVVVSDVAAMCDGRAVTIAMQPWEASVTGTPGPDVIMGTVYSDRIYALDGDDVVCGNGGDDFVYLGNGNDKFLGTASANTTVFGEDGDDSITIPGAKAQIYGGNGNDRIGAGSGATVWGDDGDDVITVGNRSQVHGGNGNDYITVGRYSEVWPDDGDDTVAAGGGTKVWPSGGQDRGHS